MQATLEELSKIFKLTGADSRQLRLGLKNKIEFIDAQKAEVKDAELLQLIKDFRNGGAMTVKEVCEQYKITPHALMEMVKWQLVSCYRLNSSKGSKVLFLKTEIEKEQELFL